MNPGDLVVIRKGTHGYSDSWVRGEDPTSFWRDTFGVFLKEFKENETCAPRTFYRLVTPFGTVNINSAFCSEVLP